MHASQTIPRLLGATRDLPAGGRPDDSPACRAGLAIPERVPVGGADNGAPCYSYCVSLSI